MVWQFQNQHSMIDTVTYPCKIIYVCKRGLWYNSTQCDTTLYTAQQCRTQLDGILPKGPYPPCLRMADRALLAGYLRTVNSLMLPHLLCSMLSYGMSIVSLLDITHCVIMGLYSNTYHFISSSFLPDTKFSIVLYSLKVPFLQVTYPSFNIIGQSNSCWISRS